MHGGRIVERGSHAELMALRGFYHTLVQHQQLAQAPLHAAPSADVHAGEAQAFTGGHGSVVSRGGSKLSTRPAPRITNGAAGTGGSIRASTRSVHSESSDADEGTSSAVEDVEVRPPSSSRALLAAAPSSVRAAPPHSFRRAAVSAAGPGRTPGRRRSGSASRRISPVR